jgi:glycosyltransferase involved in cell wall biosynthesis
MSNVQILNIKPDTTVGGDTPLVSVVIPTYNRYELLREAVGSVLCQTFRDFELIIVDDGSTDQTNSIVTDGLDADATAVFTSAAIAGLSVAETASVQPPSAFQFIQISHTGMPGAVRNIGVEAARGRYVAFLDSDDLWMRQKLQKQIELMSSQPSTMISHTREAWLRNGKVVSQASQHHTREGRIFADSLAKCIIGPSTVMMDRALYQSTGGFRDDIEIGEDYEYWLRITPRHEVAYLDVPLTVKRAGHADQLTVKYGHIEFFRINALRGLVDGGYFEGADLHLARTELSRKCHIYAMGSAKRGKDEEAEEYEALSLEYSV